MRLKYFLFLGIFLMIPAGGRADEPSKLAKSMAKKSLDEFNEVNRLLGRGEVKEYHYLRILQNFSAGLLLPRDPDQAASELSQDRKKVLTRVNIVLDGVLAYIKNPAFKEQAPDIMEMVERLKTEMAKSLGSETFKGYGDSLGGLNTLTALMVTDSQLTVLIDKMLATASEEEKKTLNAEFK